MDNWKDLYQQYDNFLIDVWGVLMDGTNAFPLANDLLQDLHKEGKQVVLISNTPDRSQNLKNILDTMHIRTDLVQDIITSGEAARIYVSKNSSNIGKNYYKIGSDRHDELLNGLGFIKKDEYSKIDFLLATSYDENFCKESNMKKFIIANTPMFCINPDLSIKTLEGEVLFCAGEIARRYEELGGEVIYVGKPYKLIFEIAMDSFTDQDLKRTIMIGDNPQTDIVGASQVGIDCAHVNHESKSPLANYYYENFTQTV